MNRVFEVNKALVVKYGKGQIKLKRGAGYYYINGPLADPLPKQGIYVYRAETLTVKQWLNEIDELLK